MSGRDKEKKTSLRRDTTKKIHYLQLTWCGIIFQSRNRMCVVVGTETFHAVLLQRKSLSPHRLISRLGYEQQRQAV